MGGIIFWEIVLTLIAGGLATILFPYSGFNIVVAIAIVGAFITYYLGKLSKK